jgi:hypothetical protein
MDHTTAAAPWACDMAALTVAERVQRQTLADQLAAVTEEVHEVAGGYAFRYQAALLPVIAAFVALERRCCPFLRFTLDVEPADGPLWLSITGPEGVTDLIPAALGLAGHRVP